MSKPRWQMSKETFEKLLRCLNDDRDRAGEKYEHIRRSLVTYYQNNLKVNFREDLVDKAINRIAKRIEEGAEIIYVKSAEEQKSLLEDSEEEFEELEREEEAELASKPADRNKKTDLGAETACIKKVIFAKGKEELTFLWAAKFIVKECNKATNKREVSLESKMTNSNWEPSFTEREKTKRAECLERCRIVVSDADYEFILDYYSGDTYQKGKEGKQQKEVREEMAKTLGISMKALKSKARRIREWLRPCLEECAKE